MEELKERKEMDPAYEWNLSSLFENDEAWEKAFAEADSYIKDLASKEGTLKDAKSIYDFLVMSTAYSRKMEDLFVYANCRHDEDTAAAKGQVMFSKAYGKLVEAETASSYAEPEILSLSNAELEAVIENPMLSDYRIYLKDLQRQKEHTLSAPQEKVIASFGEALAASENAAEALCDADMKFESVKDGEGQTHELTQSNYILLQQNHDRTLRENSFRSYYKSFAEHINTFSATYTGTVKKATAEAALRGYPSSRAMSMAGDNIPESVYDTLIDTVHKRMDVMYRYVKLRKRLLGVDELHYYDVYAPLAEGPSKKYSYEDAKEMVLKAVSPLGKEYTDQVKKAYSEGWIDVYPNKGKRGGAYSSGSYDSRPIILTNFTGTLDSVSTLAHEMGHSMHTWHTKNHQPAQYANYSMFVAEVASTVNENLLIEQLLADEKDPATRLALLNQYLEGFKGTVYRQTMFAEFEKEAHAASERGEALDPETLNNLYFRLVKEYFGPELIMDDEVKYEWARIPHFYYLFYVYVYATGYSAATALSEAILNQGEPAVKKYLEFLDMGSSEYPIDELKHAGVDLTSPDPINAALDKFEKVLEDAEKTASLLGK
jgi:oligoendopeptidase F